ncbi:leucine-rich repeat domain-containing protein [Apibacter raozihei]|uniref:leucine-rich repeat domain-containing protein n=1 Tax=Apibacter raozihei TaxID=2500547 RepID=UPI000FE43489|nr:leucine-rich repeat domain-containing protein [Apibacter raozihei]
MKKLLFLVILLSFKLSAQHLIAAVEDKINENGYYTQLEYALKNKDDVKNLYIKKRDADNFLNNSELYFPNLEVLIIQFSDLTDFKSLANNSKLKEISFRYSWKLQSLPNDITNLPQLEKASFTNAFLSYLPSSFFDNTSLKEVCLCNNNLFKLPDIPENNTIRYLSLDINHFKKLPASMINLQKLQILGLKDCHFSEFPIEIFELKNIKTLDLSANPISSIPEKLSELSSLENLYLIKTQIKELPKSMKKQLIKTSSYE